MTKFNSSECKENLALELESSIEKIKQEDITTVEKPMEQKKITEIIGILAEMEREELQERIRKLDKEC